MKRNRYIVYFIICTGIICTPSSLTAQAKKHILAFASDTQSPLLIERAIRKLDHNEKATECIFKDVASRRPEGLFLLGDVVSLGYKNSKWVKIDTYLKLLYDKNIPAYATLGNHELMLNAAKGKQNFKARFAGYSITGFSVTTDSVAVILLNSNFDKMTCEEIAAQNSWYANKLTELDKDAAVKFIIVGCHHSPFTNSKVVKPSLPVQQKFVPEFISSKKCVLFLSGHSHNFERFNVQGKTFLVIGGGGGPHQLLNVKKQSTTDLAADYKPTYHYLEVTRDHDAIQITSRQLKPNFSGFIDGLKFNLQR